MKHLLSTSELLESIAKNHEKETISLGEIKDSLHERGFGVLFIVFCLPLLIPLPIPTGLGTAMALPIFFFSFQLITGADSPWLPSWVMKKELNIETFRKIVSKSMKPLKYIEKFLKERMLYISESRSYEIFTGIFILLLNIPIALPFPMSNTIPALSVIIISLGMLEKDGLMIIIGKIIGLISWIICIFIGFLIIYGANKAANNLPESVKNLKHILEPEIEAYKDFYNNNNDNEYKSPSSNFN